MQSLKKSDLRRSWQNSWIRADYSWKGLVSKATPSGTSAKNCQEFLRTLSGNRQDSVLVEMGILIKCRAGELFHVLYIPPHWTKNYVEDIDKFLAIRSRVFKLFKSAVQNISSFKAHGFSFFPDENHSFLGQIHRFIDCYFSAGADPIAKKSNLFIRGTFIDGSLETSNNFGSHVDWDMAESYVCGSVRPHVPDSEWIGLTIKKCKIVDVLKLSNCRVRGFRISHSIIGALTVDSCDIEGKVEIANLSLRLGLTLDSSDFASQVSISEADISNFARFTDCDFDDRVVFRDVRWPIGKVKSALTTGSRFKELVTFTSSDPPPVQLFDGGEFEANIGFDSRYNGRWNEAFFSELKSQNFDPTKSAILASRIEASCRNLRNLAQGRGDGPMEHFWHRAEIIARGRTSSVGALERTASGAYGLFADYGLSIGRPFLWLLGLWLLLGIAYGYLGGPSWIGNLQWTSLEQGIGFSLHQTFPLGIFDDPDAEWLQGLIGKTYTFENIAIRLVATAQTILSAILIYLGVMAIRRKFKII